MNLNFWRFNKYEKAVVKKLYEDADNLVEIEFANNTSKEKYIWVEPSCVEIYLKSETEYKVISHDRSFRIEFDDEGFIFYFQYSFGFKLYRRPASKESPNPHEWLLDYENSEIN